MDESDDLLAKVSQGLGLDPYQKATQYGLHRVTRIMCPLVRQERYSSTIDTLIQQCIVD